MQVSVISFEITDFTACTTEVYLVLNTLDNQEKIFTHRYTRHIVFDMVFNFQFEKEMRMPLEFIEMDIWVEMLNQNPELAAVANDLDSDSYAYIANGE